MLIYGSMQVKGCADMQARLPGVVSSDTGFIKDYYFQRDILHLPTISISISISLFSSPSSGNKSTIPSPNSLLSLQQYYTQYPQYKSRTSSISVTPTPNSPMFAIRSPLRSFLLLLHPGMIEKAEYSSCTGYTFLYTSPGLESCY